MRLFSNLHTTQFHSYSVMLGCDYGGWRCERIDEMVEVRY